MWPAFGLAASLALFGGDTPSPIRTLGNGAFFTRVQPAAVAVSPDGRRVAATGQFGVRIWDASTGRRSRDLNGLEGMVVAIAFSPDGRTLAAVDSLIGRCGNFPLGPAVVVGPTVRLWDVESGTELRRIRCNCDGPSSLAFSPDGDLLAGPNNARGISVWDVETGEERRRVSCKGNWYSVAFIDGGRTLACTEGDDAIHFVDVVTGEETHRFRTGFEQASRCVISPDSKIAIVSGNDGGIRILDSESGSPTALLRAVANVGFPVAFSDDGSLAAFARDGRIEVWQRDRERRLFAAEFDRDSRPIGLAFSKDGGVLAFSTADGVRVLDVATGTERFGRKARRSAIASVGFAPDGKTVLGATRFGTSAQVWDVATGKEVATLRDRLWPWAISPDGRHLASRGKSQYSLDLWDVATPSAPAPLADLPGDPIALAFSPDGNTLAATSGDGVVRFFDVETHAIRGRATMNSPWKSPIAFSPDGRFLAVPDGARVVAVLDPSTGVVARRFAGAIDDVQAIAWSPDGSRFAAVDAAGSATTWQARSAALERHWVAHAGHAGSVAFAPDGRTLATSGSDGIAVWDAASGERLARLPGGDEWPACLAFSPDGRILAAGDDDGTVTLWPAPPRR